MMLAPAACQSSRKAVKLPPITTPSLQSRRLAYETAAQAQAAAEKGKTDEAIELYRESVTHDPEYGYAWHNLGVLYASRQEYLDAVDAYNKAAALLTNDPRPICNIGQVWLDLGYARDALRNFEEALRRDPQDIIALRGAIQSAHLLDIADETTAERIKTALITERDPVWRDYFELQRSRVSGRLAEQRNTQEP